MTMGFVTGQRAMRQDCHGITLLRGGQAQGGSHGRKAGEIRPGPSKRCRIWCKSPDHAVLGAYCGSAADCLLQVTRCRGCGRKVAGRIQVVPVHGVLMESSIADRGPEAHPQSWYAETAGEVPAYPTLKGSHLRSEERRVG